MERRIIMLWNKIDDKLKEIEKNLNDVQEKLQNYKYNELSINQENIQKFNKYDKIEQDYIIDFGMKMYDVISSYAINKEEILSISKDVANYVTQTRITNLKPLLFDNGIPKNPYKERS